MSRGGKRQGAGRKAGPANGSAKVAITVRVKQDAADNFDAYRKSQKLSQSRAFEAWASKLKTA